MVAIAKTPRNVVVIFTIITCALILFSTEGFSLWFRSRMNSERFSHEPILYIIPGCGLANRLQVLICSLIHNRNIRVYWEKSVNLPVAFEELFTYPLVQIKSLDTREITGMPFYYTKNLEKSGVFKNLIRQTRRAGAGAGAGAGGAMMIYNMKSIPKDKSAVFNSCHRVCSKNADYFETAASIIESVVPDIKLPIERFFYEKVGVGPNKRHSIGVHIRSVDIIKNKRINVPMKFDVQKKRAEIAAHARPDTVIFLATDDPSNINILKKWFPLVYQLPRSSYDRNDPRSIKEAVGDLYMLYLCDTIVGTPGSSFSELPLLTTKHQK